MKSLKVEGDSELIVNKVCKECKASHPRMRRYRNTVWDEIELFDAFNISHIGREINREADVLARLAISFDPTLANPYI